MKRLLFLLSWLPIAAFAQPNYLLEGTLGKQAIYLYFEDYSSGNDIKIGEVRYCYKSQLRDIVLDGTRNGNHFESGMSNSGNEKMTEKFVLSKNGDIFKGTWKKSDNSAALPVSLRQIPTEAVYKQFPNSPITASDEFNLLDVVRATMLVFKQDSVATYKGKRIVWYNETHGNTPFFRLGEGFSESVKKTVNPWLEYMHSEMAVQQLSCASHFEYSDGNGIEYTVKIGYLDEDLLGFQIFRSWYCGGAHPDFSGECVLLDLHDRNRYDLDDVVAFDQSVTTERAGGFKAYADYREMYFAPTIYGLVNSEQHFKKPTEGDEDSCDYTDLEIWNFVGWNYTENGIEFTSYFARYLRSCEESFLVPFVKLERYRNPKFPYHFGGKK